MKTPFGIRHGRIVQLTAAALAGGLISAGGYALASGSSSTIHGCVDRSRAHLLHVQRKCDRGQRRISWSQRGPRGQQGPTGQQGRTGSQGASGTPAAGAWGYITASGSLLQGSGLAVQHVSPGVYQLNVTAPQCAQRFNAATVTVINGNPPSGQPAGTFPYAWVGFNGPNQFTVFTGLVANGAFGSADQDFVIHDTC